MSTGILFHLAHLIVLSSSALIPDTRKQGIFCFHTKSEFGRTQCSFLRRPSAGASVHFYWAIWTTEHSVEECFISSEPAVYENYMSACSEQGMWDLHTTSSLYLNITVLFEPGTPCQFQPVGRWNSRSQRYLDTSYHGVSATRKRQKRAWILPGTLWCGHGSRAGDYEQLGMFERVDRCCREHDHCDRIIRPFSVNFGVFNPSLFTISHCECDRRFKQCLLDINDTVSNMVGYTFFNILKQQCFELVQKKRCTKINWIGMCTTEIVAPFAVLKHSIMYNATSSDAGILEPPVYQGKSSTTIKWKSKKHKQRKQSLKVYTQGVPAAEHTGRLSEVTGKPDGKPNTVLPTSSTTHPNFLMCCNSTLFHQKSKIMNQRTPFTAADIATMQTPISTIKQKTATLKKITLNKSKQKNKRIDITTVQTKLIKRHKHLSTKVNGDLAIGDHFLPKQQRRKDSKQDKFLYSTILPNLLTSSLASRSPSTKKLFAKVSETKKDSKNPRIPRRKMASDMASSRSHPKKTKKTEMNRKSDMATKLPIAWNQTKPAYGTFQATVLCDAIKHLDDCKDRISPMEKLYGHHNTEKETIYHCDCINSLTDHLKSLENIALLDKFLWKFVSMYCFEMQNNKKCRNNTRCSAKLFKATELKSTLIKLQGQVSVKNTKTSTYKRESDQLYKHCIRILQSRSLKHVKHNP